MLFDLISTAKVHIILVIPNKNLLLFEKFICFVAFFCKKICFVYLKIPIGKRNKNYGCTLFCKNPRSAKNFGASVASRPEWCKCSGVLQRIAHDESSTGESRNTRPPKESRRAKTNKFFALYIGIEKYLQKMLKKICKYRNLL